MRPVHLPNPAKITWAAEQTNCMLNDSLTNTANQAQRSSHVAYTVHNQCVILFAGYNNKSTPLQGAIGTCLAQLQSAHARLHLHAEHLLSAARWRTQRCTLLKLLATARRSQCAASTAQQVHPAAKWLQAPTGGRAW